MTDSTTARAEEPDLPAASPHAPLVVSQGLTYRDVQRAIFLAFGLVIVYHLAAPLTTLLLFFLLVFILAAVVNPLAVRLERRGVPRLLTAVGVMATLLGLLVLLASLLIPPLTDEVGKFITDLPSKQGRLTGWYEGLLKRYPALADHIPSPEALAQTLTANAAAVMGQVGRYTMNLAAAVLMTFLLVVLVIFTVGRPAPLIAGLLAAAPRDQRDRMECALRRILDQLKNWAFGSLVLGGVIGVMTSVGLWLLGLLTHQHFPYILMFSIIAGIGEMIPNIGPILSAIPPALVGAAIDPLLGVWVLLLFFIIQQLENHLVVPLVMGHSLDLHPVSVTFTVLVMGVLFGLMGAILAVPVCAIVKIMWEEFYLAPRHTDMEALQAVAADIVAHACGGGPEPRGDGRRSAEGVE